MSKPSIIGNWKYQKPSKGGHRGLKKLLKARLGLPATKQKLGIEGMGFLKDAKSLAHYNCGGPQGRLVTLGVKERGGRKK